MPEKMNVEHLRCEGSEGGTKAKPLQIGSLLPRAAYKETRAPAIPFQGCNGS